MKKTNKNNDGIMSFSVPVHAAKRVWAVYIIVAIGNEKANQSSGKKKNKIWLYVGKVGDNRDGCNPLISRIGNHISYNETHSQLRNKLPIHKISQLRIHYATFGNYDERKRHEGVNKINQLERELNKKLQEQIKGNSAIELLNPYSGKYVRSKIKEQRAELIKERDRAKLQELIKSSLATETFLGNTKNN